MRQCAGTVASRPFLHQSRSRPAHKLLMVTNKLPIATNLTTYNDTMAWDTGEICALIGADDVEAPETGRKECVQTMLQTASASGKLCRRGIHPNASGPSWLAHDTLSRWWPWRRLLLVGGVGLQFMSMQRIEQHYILTIYPVKFQFLGGKNRNVTRFFYSFSKRFWWFLWDSDLLQPAAAAEPLLFCAVLSVKC